jgi:hypothetical protein
MFTSKVMNGLMHTLMHTTLYFFMCFKIDSKLDWLLYYDYILISKIIPQSGINTLLWRVFCLIIFDVNCFQCSFLIL